MIERISQSMMKDMRAYLDGSECGLLVREKYILGNLLPGSASMKLGAYFEYILTGQLPKDGKKPEPEYMETRINANIKAGKPPLFKLGIPDMYDDYRKAHQNRERVLSYWADMGLEIAEDKKGPMSGRKYVKGRFEGTIDIIMIATKDIVFASGFILKKGEKICVDLKYSGLLEDKYSKHGWMFTNEQKKYHGTQAKQYHFLTGLDFFFFVVSPKNGDVGFFRMLIEPYSIEKHLSEGNDLFEKLDYHNYLGFEPRPSFNNCKDCPLKTGCKFKHTFPHAVDVDINTLD